jgi:hypothetical protein
VAPRLEALLAESVQWIGGKQRLTGTRLHQMLRAEGHRIGVTLVRDAVAEWQRQRRKVMIPLTYRAGDLAEVDFFEVLIDVAGQRRKPCRPRPRPARRGYASSAMASRGEMRAARRDGSTLAATAAAPRTSVAASTVGR